MKTKSSLPRSQKFTIGPNPQTDESNPTSQFLQNIFLNYISSSMPRVFKIISFLQISPPKFYIHLFFLTCITYPTELILLDVKS
jgi:hypothetical protein